MVVEEAHHLILNFMSLRFIIVRYRTKIIIKLHVVDRMYASHGAGGRQDGGGLWHPLVMN